MKNFYNFKIPRIFKIIQNKLNIESEVKTIKNQLFKHKYKICFISSITLFPFYYPYFIKFKNYSIKYFSNKVYNQTQEDSELYKTLTSFIKQTLFDVIKDDNIKKESIYFLLKIVKEPEMMNALLKLLINLLKEEKFLKEVKLFGKEVGVHILKDEEVINNLMITLIVL